MKQACIKIDSVFLSYGTHQVLRGVHLGIREHQVTGILGRNGCGKSCLLKILTGQIEPQSKHIQYQGQQIKNPYTIKGLINYLPQHECHPKSLTLSRLLHFYGIDLDHFMETYPFLQPCLHQRLSDLSGGEVRLIEVLLVLESDATFTILDEPFTHVMPKYIDLIKSRIVAKKASKGLLITDHQYQNVLDISDELHLIADGAIRKVEGEEDLRFHGYIR
jgi:ABC-type multidrug transport system ATPase subunit